MNKEEKSNMPLETIEPDGFLIISNDRIAECSTRFLEILGCSSEREIIGLKFYDLAPTLQPNGRESFELYREMVDELHLKGKSRFEFILQTTQGNAIWFELFFSWRYMEGKKIIGVVVRRVLDHRATKSLEIKEESIYGSIFNNSHTPMLIIDSEDGEIKDGNLAACNYYGYDIKELLQLNISDINTLNQQELFKEMGEAKKENRKYFRFKHRLSCGEIREVEVYSGPLSSNYNSLLFSIIHDVQDKKEMEDKIKMQESYFRGLYENSPEAIVVLDNEFRIISINKSFEKIFQYSADEIKQQNITKVLCEEKLYDESSYFKDSITRGEFVREETLRRRKDGKLIDVSFLGYPIMSNGEQIGVYGVYSDLSNVKEKENRIEVLTSKDGLTDLYNRDYFINKLNYEISRRNNSIDKCQELAIIFLDLDDFKEINDTLGHLAGDNVLVEFAARLKASIREYDIPARFGGDEFIVMLPHIKENYKIIHIANRILEETNKPFLIDNVELHLTASLGIARYPEDGSDSTILIRNADIAMYRSKESKSKKITMFESALDEEIKEYFKFKNNLRNALANKELFLEYQPIIDVAKNQMVGTEALLRWNFNGSEIISPMKFIPIAEKNGFMQSIGEWVMNEACSQNMVWQNNSKRPIYVSVNVSIIQLEQPNFCEVVKEALKNSKMDPEYLQLEITETIFTKNYDKIVETIKSINELGIKIAIDDFGTGYSSLGQLSRLDIAKLKIDKSFISEINKNENKNKIVKAIISLANSLKLELTAEGVETSEQLDFLLKNDCNIVQGYLYSKPIDAGAIEKLF
jgi:diguanylate cyclase (GGDEF)-like protein/PAS domain S-box-containing protein